MRRPYRVKRRKTSGQHSGISAEINGRFSGSQGKTFVIPAEDIILMFCFVNNLPLLNEYGNTYNNASIQIIIISGISMTNNT